MINDQTILLFYQLETSLYHAVANLLTDWKWPETEISPSFDFLLIGFLPHRISYSGMKTRAGPHFKADPPWPLTTFAKQSKLQIENPLITIETDEIQSLSWLRYMDVWFFRTSWHLKSRNCIKSIWHFCVFFWWRFEAEKIFSDMKNPFRKYLFQMDFNPLLFLPKLYCFKADILTKQYWALSVLGTLLLIGFESLWWSRILNSSHFTDIVSDDDIMPFDWCTFLIGPPGVIIVSLKMMRTEKYWKWW